MCSSSPSCYFPFFLTLDTIPFSPLSSLLIDYPSLHQVQGIHTCRLKHILVFLVILGELGKRSSSIKKFFCFGPHVNSSSVEVHILIFKNNTKFLRRIIYESIHIPFLFPLNPELIVSRSWSKRKECKISFVLDHIYLLVQNVDFDPEPSIMCFFSWPWLYISDVKLLTDGSMMIFRNLPRKKLFCVYAWMSNKKNNIHILRKRDGLVPCKSIEDILIVSLIQNIWSMRP